MPARLVPELDVTHLDVSLRFYCQQCGFDIAYSRPEESFACLRRGEIELMLQSAAGPGRRFRAAPLERPFGRGVNLQIEIDDAAALHRRLVHEGASLVIDLEERWYETGEGASGNLQFVVADPDGYLLRFFTDLGRR